MDYKKFVEDAKKLRTGVPLGKGKKSQSARLQEKNRKANQQMIKAAELTARLHRAIAAGKITAGEAFRRRANESVEQILASLEDKLDV